MVSTCKYTTVVPSSPLSSLEGCVNMDAVYLSLFVFGLHAASGVEAQVRMKSPHISAITDECGTEANM